MKKSDVEGIVSALLYEIDKYLAITGLILAIAILYLIGLRGSIVGVLVSVLLIISCLLWLSIRNRDLPNNGLLDVKKSVYIWAIAFFILYALSILCVYFRQDLYSRPPLYFILTSLMAGTIACQTLTASRRHIGIILFQVILIGMSLTWTQQLITPGLIGIDPWYHQYFTNSIIDQHILPTFHAYSQQPFFHLLIAMTSLMTSLSYKYSTIISVSFGMITCFSFFLFLIGNLILKNYRIGLLASLSVVIAPLVILMSYWTIPNSFGPVFMIILLYVLLIKHEEKIRVSYTILIILLMSAIILTHPLVAMCMAIILFFAWGTFTLYNKYYQIKKITLKILVPIGFAVAMFAWWTYISFRISSIATFFKYDYSIIGEFDKDALFSMIDYSPVESLFQTAGGYLFLIFSFIGIFYMISKKGNDQSFTYAIVSILPLFFSFSSIITGSFILGYRWTYISQILMGIPLALAIYLIGCHYFKKEILQYCFVFIFIVSLSFLTISCHSGSNDFNPFTEITKDTNYFTYSELEGSVFFSKSYTSVISTDNYYGANALHYLRGTPLDCYKNDLEDQIQSGVFYHDGSLKVVRETYVDKLQRRGFIPLNFNPLSHLSYEGFNKIYDNTGIAGFIG